MNSDTLQPSTVALGERTASPAVSASHSGNSSENSSVETSVNGSKKRKRSSTLSCELCKRRKVKCDKVKPSCSGCARNGRICEYREKRKPGLRAGYGRELESKINRLEAIIQALGRRVEDHIFDHESNERLGPPRPNYQPPDITRYPGSPHSGTADIGFQGTPTSTSRWPDNNAFEGMQYLRSSDAMSVHSMVDLSVPETLPRPDRPRSTAPNTVFRSVSTLSSEPDPLLPPYDLLYALVDLYFKHVNTWSPILDRKVIFDTLFGSSIPSEQDRVLLHAIVATTLRFSKDSRLTPDYRKRYHDISKQTVQLYGLEHSNVRALQALIILSLDVLGTSNGPQAWNLLALIARSIVQLGLAVEKSVSLVLPTYPPIVTPRDFLLPAPKSWVEDEERRRLCWMVFVLDRYATVATTNFEFALKEEEMDRQLPCQYDLFSQNQAVETRWSGHAGRLDINRPENLGSFSYHCEILKILSRIHSFLRKPIDIGSLADVARWQKTYRQLDEELDTWLVNLPEDYGRISQLCHSDPSSKVANWIMLHAAFHTSVIHLHSSAAYPIVRSHIFTPSYTAMQKCLAAAEGLKDLAQDVVSAGMADLLGPPFAFSLWVSVRLLLVHGSTTDGELNPNVAFFASTLEKLGQYWEIARSYTQILSGILQEYQQTRQAAGFANGDPSSTGKTFAMMRSCAYKLNFQLSQQPQSVIDPASVRTPAPNELEYLEVFDFFNYPRIPTTLANALNMPDSSAVIGTLAHMNIFPTTNFAVPNPESDWLTFKPPHD